MVLGNPMIRCGELLPGCCYGVATNSYSSLCENQIRFLRKFEMLFNIVMK